MTFSEAISSGFRRYFDFMGRSIRSEYWFWTLFVFLVSIPLQLLTLVAPILLILSLIFSIATMIPGLAVTIRRLHDLDRTGWWTVVPAGLVSVGYAILIPAIVNGRNPSVIAYVPFIAAFAFGILLLVWFCTKGTDGPNRFGDDPLGKSDTAGVYA
ncbi:MAG: DUF805 domain-containing protein [Pseudomonadota bacterium]